MKLDANVVSWKTEFLLVLVGRGMLMFSLPYTGWLGYGDLLHYYTQASMGWAMVQYWVEYPPLFPYISRLFYLLAGGQEHVYVYLLGMLMALSQAGSVVVFRKIYELVHEGKSPSIVPLVYLVLTIGLPYGWWYMDALVVFAMLMGLYMILRRRDLTAALWLTAGVLTKIFPLLVLPIYWKLRRLRESVVFTLIVVGVTVIVYSVFFALAPEMTHASIASQWNKGSWETIWALVDGNLETGSFGGLSERYDVANAYRSTGAPARIPAWLTLIVFGTLGLWLYMRLWVRESTQAVALLGLVWCIFLLWLPGWSPQWSLYLIPLLLLVLPERTSVISAVILVMINLLEWPLLLSRGYNWGLWVTVPLRTAMIGLWATQFYRYCNMTQTDGLGEL